MFLENIKQVKAIILDIDGVLTDGTVHVTESGEQLRKFHVRDGYALKYAIKKGFLVCIISGGNSNSVLHRFSGLGITEVHLGIEDKLEVYLKVLKEHALSDADVMYMGDDLPDIAVMRRVGVAACPVDAVQEVKACADYISPFSGGQGCVRELVETILKVQGKWYMDEGSAGDEQPVTSS